MPQMSGLSMVFNYLVVPKQGKNQKAGGGGKEKEPKINNNLIHGKKPNQPHKKKQYTGQIDEKLYLGREAWTGTRGPSWGCPLGGVGVAGNLGQHLPCRS